MGASIEEEHGYIDCQVNGRLRGSHISLAFPSVGATENIMIAASTAEGKTVIENAAREPEISDLADFLNGCGARIHGAGDGTVHIEGVEKLMGTEHHVIPDRIVAATCLAAAAVTQGKLTLKNIIPAHLSSVMPAFREMGCDFSTSGRELTISAPPKLSRVHTVRTMPYPGFPTDAVAPLMSAAVLGEGTSMFVENIFTNRYKYVGELIRMGAKIKVEERVAVVEGVRKLYGAAVEAADLRGGAALVVAGLAAEGETTVGGTKYIDRGYERIEEGLAAVGADIRRIPDEPPQEIPAALPEPAPLPAMKTNDFRPSERWFQG